MKRPIVMLFFLLLTMAALADAQVTVLFDAKGFESPTYTLGDLPGQDGWINNTSPSSFTPPQVIADPTGGGMGQIVEFDPPGNGSPVWGWVGAFRAAGPSTGMLVVMEWDQYRADIINNQAPEGDSLWYGDRLAPDGWWAVEYDQNLQASHQEMVFGVPVKGQAWQHVEYLFDFVARTITVEVGGERFTDSMDNPPTFPKYTEIQGIDFEAEPTAPGLPDDGPMYVDNFVLKEISLMNDVNKIYENTGGIVNLSLDAGPANAGRNYLLLGSVTGTSPGIPLPGGKVTLPLNWDMFTNIVIDFINTPIFWNFMGTLNGSGAANAKFDTLGPITGAAGLTMNFAYALNSPWNFVSNPVGIEIVP